MVYLLKMVIFHGYVSHNQRVIPNDGGKAIPHGTHEAVNDHTRDFWGKKDVPSLLIIELYMRLTHLYMIIRYLDTYSQNIYIYIQIYIYIVYHISAMIFFPWLNGGGWSLGIRLIWRQSIKRWLVIALLLTLLLHLGHHWKSKWNH